MTTPRDIRLQLASLLDQLGQVQNTEAWETVTQSTPALSDQFQIAQNAMDELWYLWRTSTTKSTDE